VRIFCRKCDKEIKEYKIYPDKGPYQWNDKNGYSIQVFCHNKSSIRWFYKDYRDFNLSDHGDLYFFEKEPLKASDLEKRFIKCEKEWKEWMKKWLDESAAIFIKTKIQEIYDHNEKEPGHMPKTAYECGKEIEMSETIKKQIDREYNRIVKENEGLKERIEQLLDALSTAWSFRPDHLAPGSEMRKKAWEMVRETTAKLASSQVESEVEKERTARQKEQIDREYNRVLNENEGLKERIDRLTKENEELKKTELKAVKKTVDLHLKCMALEEQITNSNDGKEDGEISLQRSR